MQGWGSIDHPWMGAELFEAGTLGIVSPELPSFPVSPPSFGITSQNPRQRQVPASYYYPTSWFTPESLSALHPPEQPP